MWTTGSVPSTTCVRIIKSPQLRGFYYSCCGGRKFGHKSASLCSKQILDPVFDSWRTWRRSRAPHYRQDKEKPWLQDSSLSCCGGRNRTYIPRLWASWVTFTLLRYLLLYLKDLVSHNLEVIGAISFAWSYLYSTLLSFRIIMIPQFASYYNISLEKELFL